MLISILSQEQLHRQSPVPVLSTRGVRVERGVKPQGSLGLVQPATPTDRIRFPASFIPPAFLDL